MTRRPSLRELLGVWLIGAVAEILGGILVEDAAAMTAGPVVGGVLFFLTPLFLVVYSLVWAWPLAARGDRVAVSALLTFAMVVEAVSGWFWVGVHAITLTTVVMRLLAVLSPLAFGACAVSAVWAYRRRAPSRTATIVDAQDPADPASVGFGRQRDVAELDGTRRGQSETARRLDV